MTRPRSQTNFLPLLIHVNLTPLLMLIDPNLLHEVPDFEEAENEVPGHISVKKRPVAKANPNLFFIFYKAR